MANNFGINPIKIDTAFAGAQVPATPMAITKVYWENPTTAGHTFSLQQSDGTIIVEGVTSVANTVGNTSQVFDFVPARLVSSKGGYKVPTLGSGTLWLYTKGP